MNIMLVSVTQTHAGNWRGKGVGCAQKDILFQFLAEALVITAVGGLLGILLSYIVSVLCGQPDSLQRDR